eukprot:194263-Chlamydomonas_euryale.AAC.1
MVCCVAVFTAGRGEACGLRAAGRAPPLTSSHFASPASAGRAGSRGVVWTSRPGQSVHARSAWRG